MATRRKPAEETPMTFDFANVQAAPAAPVVHLKANPLKRLIQQSIDEGYASLEITVPVEAKQEAVNMLRRAVLPVAKGGLDVGLTLTSEDHEDGSATIRFQTKAQKKKRNYTVADVREWAATQPEIPKALYENRVDRDVSRAYRQAHGLEAVKGE